MTAGSDPVPGTGPNRKQSFLSNVLWSWTGVAATLFVAVFLSPYMVRKLGDSGYGLWVLTFSMVEYYMLTDAGFKSAVMKYVAHHRALGEASEINRVLSTAVVYFCGVAAVLSAVTVIVSAQAGRLFQVAPEQIDTFSFLVLVVGVGWSIGMVFMVFSAALEAFQRFDLSSRVQIIALVLRASSLTLLLASGRGLRAVAAVAVSCQVLLYLMSLLAFRRVFPALRVSPSLVSAEVFRKLFRYGAATLPSTAAWLLLLQGPSLVIGHLRPPAFVGYYGLSWRLTQASLDLVYRVGQVTTAKTAELCARGEHRSILELAQYTNRYSLTLFFPPWMFLVLFGGPLLTAWVGAEFSAQSAGLLPLMATGVLVADAAQFNSSSVLFGLARHRLYAVCLLAEAVCTVTAMRFVIPAYGLAGAAAAGGAMMVLNRGLLTPWLVCRALNARVAGFLGAIYLRPLAVAVPVMASAWWMKHTLRFDSLWTVLAGGVWIAGFYYALAFAFCLDPAHRRAFLAKAGSYLPALYRPASKAE